MHQYKLRGKIKMVDKTMFSVDKVECVHITKLPMTLPTHEKRVVTLDRALESESLKIPTNPIMHKHVLYLQAVSYRQK